jgi:hypothetical protein
MTLQGLRTLTAPPRTIAGWQLAARLRAANPALLFAVLSLLFGSLLVWITPPLRGPDEAAHFLRAYGIAQGELIAKAADPQGRKGLYLPHALHRDFAFYEAVNGKERKGFGSRAAIEAHENHGSTPPRVADEPTTFVLYEGAEGYAPISYLPYTATALAARLAELDFTTTLYLMRFAGLAATTALIAYAIALAPWLGWALLAIAMLPAALYGRAVISADGFALASAMLVTAVSLRAALRPAVRSWTEQAFWMAVCMLTKPSNVALLLLPAMQHRLSVACTAFVVTLVGAPALLVSLLWFGLSAGDAGSWRLVELTGVPAEQFTLGWKLRSMADDPLAFPAMIAGTLKSAGELWRQLIGVLGLFDAPLQLWVYPVLSAALAASVLGRLPASPATRLRLGAIAAVTFLGYSLAVFFILYVVWTPANAAEVWGVQGRYFIPALPALALALSALVNRTPPKGLRAALAIAAGALSGLTSVDAVLRAG